MYRAMVGKTKPPKRCNKDKRKRGVRKENKNPAKRERKTSKKPSSNINET